MKNVLATVSLIVGTLAALLQMADWLLSKKQKKAFTYRLYVIWNWLDDQSTGRFVPKLWGYKLQFVLSLGFVAAMTITLLSRDRFSAASWTLSKSGFPLLGRDNIALFTVLSSVILAFFIIHHRVMSQAAASTGTRTYLMFTLRKLLLYLILAGLASWLEDLLPILSRYIPSLKDYEYHIVLLAEIPFFTEVAILLFVLVFAILWTVITWLLVRILRVVAFVLRRALEQEKGALAGAAALLLLIAAVLKFK